MKRRMWRKGPDLRTGKDGFLLEFGYCACSLNKSTVLFVGGKNADSSPVRLCVLFTT